MKHYYTLVLTFLITFFITAQDGYNFTLINNGNYSFSIAATANFDSGTFLPQTESYGFTIVVPDGTTITVTDVQPTGSSEVITPIQGTDVAGIDPSFSNKDLFVVTTATNAGNLPSHMTNDEISLVTFTVNGSPLTGELTLLDNNSTLASNPALAGALDSFLQVDMTDDATVNFTNGYLGQTGTTTFNFTTLDLEVVAKLNIKVTPNPVQDRLLITGLNVKAEITIVDLNGRIISRLDSGTKNEVDVSKFDPATYIIELRVDNQVFKTKFIKN